MFTMPGCTLSATAWTFSFPLAAGGAPAGGTGMALAPGPAGLPWLPVPAEAPGEPGLPVPGDAGLGDAGPGDAGPGDTVPGAACGGPVFARSAITPPAPAAAASTATSVNVRNRDRPRGRCGSGTCPYHGSVMRSVIASIKRYQPKGYLNIPCQPARQGDPRADRKAAPPGSDGPF